VGGGGAGLFRFERGRISDPLLFATDEVGVGGFGEYLRLAPPDPLYILVDLVEEDFRLDTVPHVYGKDREAVLETKTARLFRDSRYTQAIFQERETQGRRDDLYLFTSLMRPEVLDPWVSQLARLKVPVAGIFSLPMVSRSLLRRIPITAENVLLVTLQSRGGLRQTFFDGGRLKVSRLAAMPRMEHRRVVPYVIQEVERVRRYLNSLRLLGRGNPLEVYVLTHGSVLEDLERQARDGPTTRFTMVEIDSLSQKLGIESLTNRDQPYGDRLFALLLALDPPANYYASSEETRYFTLRKAGNAMTAAGVLTLVAGAGWSAIEFAKGFDRQLEMATLAKQTAFYEHRYERGKARLPNLPADGRNIREAVELVAAAGAYRQAPGPVLTVVSRALDEFPEIRLDALAWESSDRPGRGNTGAAGNAGRFRGAPPRREPATDNTRPYYQIVNIKGHLAPFDGNYRLALERVNRFADVFREMPEVDQVTILKRPLDISSRERLSGVASLTPGVGEALFELRVAVRTVGEALRS